MTLRTAITWGFILFAATAAPALAAEGFVIEVSGASLAAGAAVELGTPLSIQTGGYVVILTSDGRMLRHNGPFEGSIAQALGTPAGARAPVKKGVVAALVDLATDGGQARNRVFATRGSGRASDSGPFDITPAMSEYCYRPDVRPSFILPQAPDQDLPMLLERVTKPETSRQAYWPVGEHRLPWPRDWPAPAKGRYNWSAGAIGGTFTIRPVTGSAAADNPVAIAIEMRRLGCLGQARAALGQAIAQAKVIP